MNSINDFIQAIAIFVLALTLIRISSILRMQLEMTSKCYDAIQRILDGGESHFEVDVSKINLEKPEK